MSKKHYFITILYVLPFLFCAGQTTDTLQEKQLQEVIIKAFGQNRKLKDVPAAVNLIGKQQLERFNTTSVVSAINATPGVRMEERSPGSYRLNIRGSSLRSPFGVRNVKIYYNDIPFTDPGGNTYLNELGYYNFSSIEIIKGPGSSLYGAGTGGVMLIEGLQPMQQNGVTAAYTTGSYDLQNANLSLITGSENFKNQFSFQHQQSNGYREHSDLRRDVFTWNGLAILSDKQVLKTTFLYSDLYYQTPGALTLTEYNNNPKMARPAAGAFPSAEQSGAAIYQKSFLAGASLTQSITDNFQNTTSVYGAFTQLHNPAIRNYGRNSEPHVGARTAFKYVVDKIPFGKLTINAGAELQQSFNTVAVHKNKNGNADSLQSLDNIYNRQQFEFAQLSLDANDWNITAGASYNQTNVSFQRFVPTLSQKLNRTFKNEFTPRLSVLKKFNNTTVYSSVSKGFSPPTTAELLPSGSDINLGLSAEEGINYDAGIRSTLFNNLYVDINAFIFSLKNTIVQRRDAAGGDYYINSGRTQQRGIEIYANYPLFQKSIVMQRSSLWLSYTLHQFHYKDFKQLNTDFSGNNLPGVAPNTLAGGFDWSLQNGLFGNLTYYYSDHIPLNDANTSFANPYHLVGIKAGYNKSAYQLFAGIDNLLNEKYSLGNDINAFGGRYYNAAPGRNFYIGLSLNLKFKEHQ